MLGDQVEDLWDKVDQIEVSIDHLRQQLIGERRNEVSTKNYVKKMRVESEQMIEVVLNDQLGKKVQMKRNKDYNIGDLKKLEAA
ncbi:hypothetical protein IEQ34_018046 [Dendrobium chrysotoxum]|uniref:Uncharacterized protein n=1 Tax=Dendrobium chrysotoxum TaxID=161865 RepID=A0AAV7GDR4_DENCH|nr:hypothetical protein IEQ34_018046 [Dendrobium chrysotoxum]